MASNTTSYPKEKIKILLLENISATAAGNFTKQGYTQVQRLSKALTETELIAAIKDVHILARLQHGSERGPDHAGHCRGR